jgi:hypothetical protein
VIHPLKDKTGTFAIALGQTLNNNQGLPIDNQIKNSIDLKGISSGQHAIDPGFSDIEYNTSVS